MFEISCLFAIKQKLGYNFCINLQRSKKLWINVRFSNYLTRNNCLTASNNDIVELETTVNSDLNQTKGRHHGRGKCNNLPDAIRQRMKNERPLDVGTMVGAFDVRLPCFEFYDPAAMFLQPDECRQIVIYFYGSVLANKHKYFNRLAIFLIIFVWIQSTHQVVV